MRPRGAGPLWFIDPTDGRGSQEIDLQEGGFTAKSLGLPSGTPENNIFVSTYHTPSGSQSDFTHVTRKPLNAGFDVYGMQYIPWPLDQSVTSMASWCRLVDPGHPALPLMRSSSGTPSKCQYLGFSHDRSIPDPWDFDHRRSPGVRPVAVIRGTA